MVVSVPAMRSQLKTYHGVLFLPLTFFIPHFLYNERMLNISLPFSVYLAMFIRSYCFFYRASVGAFMTALVPLLRFLMASSSGFFAHQTIGALLLKESEVRCHRKRTLKLGRFVRRVCQLLKSSFKGSLHS